jgi:hypothetical protein
MTSTQQPPDPDNLPAGADTVEHVEQHVEESRQTGHDGIRQQPEPGPGAVGTDDQDDDDDGEDDDQPR